MKAAIEVLEKSLKIHTNLRNSFANVTGETLLKIVADFDKKIAEVKAAIDHLQRKATIIEIPSDEKIEELSKAYNNSMTSIAEGIWVPQGFIYGAQWMRDKLTPHLQRKVKKDPRVDGLPEGGVIMLIYPKTGKPYTGRYLDNGYWDDGTECMYGDKYPQYRTTDEILFYADPNDIL